MNRLSRAVPILALAMIVSGCTGQQPAPSGGSSVSSHPSSSSASTSPSATGFDKSAHSLTDPTSIWVIVNKKHPLQPKTYAPDDLVYPDVTYVNRQPMRKEMAAALVKMFAAAKKAGLGMAVQSAYRSYQTQLSVYDANVAAHGQAWTDTQSARPGYSEHQTGLAVDISASPADCSLQACFADTPQGRWLAANAWRFGFLLRYQSDKVKVTGYSYEPWHFRYIGTQLAAELHREKVRTLEEFFGVEGGDYAR